MNNDIQEILIHVLQGNPTEKEMDFFLQWYDSSQENKDFFFQVKHIYELRNGGLKPDDKKINSSWDRLKEKIERKSRHVTTFQRNKNLHNRYVRYATLVSVAAIVLLLIIVGIRLMDNTDDQIKWVEVRTESQHIPRTIQLPDGSTVQLNASSVFRYPERFDIKNREVYLDGEAYFDIVEDQQHPFIVYSEKQRISVLGTEFNIQGYSSDPYTITTLVSGKVKLDIFDNERTMRNEIVLSPNQQVFFDKELTETRVKDINTTEAISWLQGLYSFKEIPLCDITRRLEKVYGKTILISDETRRNETYTGKFFADQTLEEVIDILNFKSLFQYQLRNDTIFLHNN